MSDSSTKVQKNKKIYTVISVVFFLFSIFLLFIQQYGAALGFFFIAVIIMLQLKDKNIKLTESNKSEIEENKS